MVNPFKGSADAGTKKKSEEDGAAVGEDDGAGDDGAEGEEAQGQDAELCQAERVHLQDRGHGPGTSVFGTRHGNHPTGGDDDDGVPLHSELA